jgi:TPR repeat protein
MSTLFSRCLLLLGVFFVAVLMTPGCATLPPAQIDSFAIVDCELPGAVLRMGTGFASTGRARALRTSADDCAIRGGYYLQGDQAGYQTALKVWLPLAEQGDLQAQLYLGQIYEKGLGRAPDPAGAMRWYQRAADQGFAPAQTALAVLYENGLGTGKAEPEKALALYRQAAKLNDGLRFESELKARESEIETLKKSLESEQDKAQRLQQQLQQKNTSLEQEIKTLTVALAKAKQAQDQLQQTQAQQALAAAQTRADQNRAALAKSQRDSDSAKQALASLAKASATASSAHATTSGPKIELVSPTSLAMRGLLTVPVSGSAQSVRISARIVSQTAIRSVSINGTAVRVDAQNLVFADISMRAATTLVDITAIDQQGLIGELPFVLASQDFMPPPQTFAAAPRNFGRYHALVIGNDRYQFWEQLETPHADAVAVSEVLKNRYGFEVTTLFNATRADIFRALAALRKRLKEDDNLLVYYSGHGSWDSANQQGYWIPVDGEKDNLSNYISSSDITDQLSVIAARQVLVVADACYSGVLVKSVAEQLTAATASRSDDLLRMAQLKSRKVISSGNIRQVMDGGAGDHSIFAKQFLDALSTRKEIFPARELYEDIAPRVAEAAEGFGEQQEPQFGQLRMAGHVGGDFVFLPLL